MTADVWGVKADKLRYAAETEIKNLRASLKESQAVNEVRSHCPMGCGILRQLLTLVRGGVCRR